MEEKKLPRSEMRLWQYAGAILWLPMHIYGFPWLLLRLRPELLLQLLLQRKRRTSLRLRIQARKAQEL